MQKTYPEPSFWEKKTFLKTYDLIIIGSGIVGINAAIHFRSKKKKANILLIERGTIPMGASTKNAGFACFGSPTELISDFTKMDEETVLKTIEMRWKGLKRLRKIVGDKNMNYKKCGGFEVFDNKEKFTEILDQVGELNKKLYPITKSKHTFKNNPEIIRKSGLIGFCGMLESPDEGQLDPGQMMYALTQIALNKGITIWNEEVIQFKQLSQGVVLSLKNGLELKTENLIIATNGFAKQLLPKIKVTPARTQVLITSPIENLKLKGVFHYDEGYFYFRNVGNRVLLGGGRNLDFQGEATDQFGTTSLIQSRLEELLKKNILPGKHFQIEQRWSGIMGLGSEKKPIIERVSKNVVVAVRMGGMGVAIGSLVGELAVKELL